MLQSEIQGRAPRLLQGTAILCGIGLYSTVALGSDYPFTDPSNTGNWVLLGNVSDEFNGTQLDETKWQVCGRDGVFWNGTFTGRGVDPGTPGGWQFSPGNIRVEGGRLKITTKHEPNYPWVNPQAGKQYEYTTAGVWSKQTFYTGYMEIRCKAAFEATTSSFWTTGGPGVQSELDIFEAIGKHATRANKMWSSIHDWSIPAPNPVWTETHDLPFSFGDGFHTYAAEWDTNSVKFYADGQLITTVTKAWVEANGAYTKRWPLTGGQHLWADSEIFEWWGVPNTNNLPVDYEVEYIRVWQKGPAFLWPEYVSLYGLPGAKTNRSDADPLDDWGEYVFNGNPTNPADVGVLPVFDAATGEYTYQIRNDASLVVHVVTTTNLAASTWFTNVTVDISVNDGSMGTNTTTIGISEDQLFIKLIVKQVVPPIVYPSSKGDSVNDEWIANVTIGSINRSSGADGGYYDGTALSTTASKGSTVPVSLTPGYSGTQYNEVWRVWIDLNHDGDFKDPGEEVFAGGPSKNAVNGSFILPSTYSYTGPTRMRVSMRYNSAPPSDANFSYGEVEDYTVFIQ